MGEIRGLRLKKIEKKELTITLTRKENWNEEKSRKSVRISMKSVRRVARCLWRVGFEKKKIFEVGKEK